MSETERRIEIYNRMGWYPVPYAHHPKPIKDAIRRVGMRPQMKQCFANCQRLFLAADWLELEYHEGYVLSIIPIQHAWLRWQGQVIDLTMHRDEVEYLASNSYTPFDVRRNMLATHQWCVVSEVALAKCGPYWNQMQELHDLFKEEN